MPRRTEGKDGLDGCEDIQESISSIIPLRNYLTSEEEVEIHKRFRSSAWTPDKQVLWSGMERNDAQTWADSHHMQTLTTAMGLLLLGSSPQRPSKEVPKFGWSKYIHGASAIFACHIANGDKVTVLSPPPPQRFHPSGGPYFQTIELPILIAAIAKGASLRIEMVHPGVKLAENYRYQLWPKDEVSRWTAAFYAVSEFKYKWRMVSKKIKLIPSELALARMTRERDCIISTEKAASPTEVLIPPKRSKVFEKMTPGDRMERSSECSSTCSKRKSKKSKKKKTLPKASSTPGKKEEGQVPAAGATCKGSPSLMDDAIAAMELQYQLDFPNSQKGRLPLDTHSTMDPDRAEAIQSLTNLSAEDLDSTAASPESLIARTFEEAAESSDISDSEKRKMKKSAKTKMKKAKRAMREKQMTPEKRDAYRAERARRAATRAAKVERKTASRRERKEIKEQLTELQKLVGVTLLEYFPFPCLAEYMLARNR